MRRRQRLLFQWPLAAAHRVFHAPHIRALLRLSSATGTACRQPLVATHDTTLHAHAGGRRKARESQQDIEAQIPLANLSVATASA
jgi:hypothetical protein